MGRGRKKGKDVEGRKDEKEHDLETDRLEKTNGTIGKG